MNILIIDDNMGAGLDFAWRCIEHGHKVKIFRKPGETYGDGFPGIETVDDYRKHMAWAKTGLIFNTGNALHLRELDRYRRDFGFEQSIFSPSWKSAQLEIDRAAGIELLERHGIPTPPFDGFDSLEQAQKAVLRSDKCWVFKTLGSEEDKSLSFVSSSPDEMYGWLQSKIDGGLKLKGKCLLQEKIDMVAEVGCSGWMGSDGFLEKKWQVCFEHKKMMNGERYVTTGEVGCYDSQTEVLTNAGWKFWPLVTDDDLLATLVNGEMVFEKPIKIIHAKYDGEMIQWKNRSIDILVTPNHNMYINNQWNARNGKEKYYINEAKSCNASQYSLKRTCNWNGVSPDNFIFPGNKWDNGVCIRTTKDIVVPFTDFCKLLGIYFADGYCSGKSSLQIAKSHIEKANKIEELLKGTAFKKFIKIKDNGFTLNSAQIARIFKPFGRSYEKRVPDYIKNASPSDIREFIESFAIGDSCTRKNGTRIFYTSNPGLADDLQELMIKAGYLGIIKNRGRKKISPQINGRIINQRRDAYEIFERKIKIRSWLDLRDKKIIKYTGTVHCATVSSHVLMIRRNGKPLWCGNSVVQYSEQDRIAEGYLKPLEKAFLELGHRGDTAINGGVDKKGNYQFFELTMRGGYPAHWAQTASHKGGDPAQWMKDSLIGKDTLKVDYNPCIIVVLFIPPYPFDAKKLGMEEKIQGLPIQGFEENWEHIHPVCVKIGDGYSVSDNHATKVSQFQTSAEYVACVTALDPSLKKAKEKAYKIIDEIKIPDLGYRDDIGDKVIEVLPELHKLGYAVDMIV